MSLCLSATRGPCSDEEQPAQQRRDQQRGQRHGRRQPAAGRRPLRQRCCRLCLFRGHLQRMQCNACQPARLHVHFRFSAMMVLLHNLLLHNLVHFSQRVAQHESGVD